MMRKRWRVILGVVAIVCISFLAFMGYFMWLVASMHGGSAPSTHTVALGQKVDENGWNLTVESTTQGGIRSDKVIYIISDKNVSERFTQGWALEEGTIETISGTPSEGYNVTWYDVDNNERISFRDYIHIRSAGGSSGSAKKGYTFALKHSEGYLLFALMLQ